MRFFNFDLRKLLLVSIVLALPLLSINMQRNPDEQPWYLQATSFVASRIQGTFMSFSQGVRGTTGLYLNLIDIKKNNRELQQTNSELRAQLGVLEEVRRENERLSNLLNFRSRSRMEMVSARVIGRDAVADFEGLLINRGTEHGLKQGLAVITPDGVVGYVARADSRNSSVRVLTDRYAVIDAVVQRTRARGIVEGKSRTACRLRYIERAVDVAVGDLVVTTGVANLFPPGFPIGRVTNVEETKYGVSQKVDVEPLVHPSSLEEVFVILDPKGEDYTVSALGSNGQTPTAAPASAATMASPTPAPPATAAAPSPAVAASNRPNQTHSGPATGPATSASAPASTKPRSEGRTQ